jgi:hypothetical protein
MWFVPVWIVSSTDPIREAVVTSIVRDRTVFAPRYSESKFSRITLGIDQETVKREIGEPLQIASSYPAKGVEGCRGVEYENGRVTRTFPSEKCAIRGIRVGDDLPDVERQLGQPAGTCWTYSQSDPGRMFRLRLVCFEGRRVAIVARRWVTAPSE